METSNTSETWEHFQVGSVPPVNFKILEPAGNKQTQSP